ncbi:MAG: hypothetical protein A3H35_11820 [Betaproteobacteria bacterium RIFCSPLOWO2_02_FULL_62_17]|nr:MAG: hypothetical protein A3H35_11820 [Betaproteobacteria bacterium RIFCSPLOWO2_02_FULL_62_17]
MLRIDTRSATPVAGVIRAGAIVSVLALVGGGGWMAIASVAGAVIAPGFVKVDLNRKVVQHQEGGLVSKILVRNGDRVAQGQPLILLEDVRVDAQAVLLQKLADSEMARRSRLDAESAYPAVLRFPDEFVRRGGEPAVAEIMKRETALHATRRTALESELKHLASQILEVEREAAALERQVAAERRALEVQKEELAMNAELAKQNFVQKTRVMTLERATSEYTSRMEERTAELAKTRQRGVELRLRASSLGNDFRKQAAAELRDSTDKLVDLLERLRPSKDAAQRQRIVAPAAGEVVNLQVFTPGAVIGPREVLAEIVPDERKLVVEANVRPEDINYLKAGVVANVRLTAYKQRTTPLLTGAVTYVSGDRLTEQRQGQSFFVAHVEIPETELAKAPEIKLQAGMPAEVFFITDERTVLDYLLAPVTNYLRRAGREPL